MKNFRNISKAIAITTILITAITAGCSPEQGSNAQDSTNPQLNAINDIRKSLKLTELPLDFVEKTTDVNSPNGLEITVYQDSEGRRYSVSSETNQVVEIDARAILEYISPDIPTLSIEALRAKAMAYAKATVPNFSSLQSSWQYEEGGKVGTYFFNWYGELTPGSTNRPRIQICLHQSGLLFCYYNTLTLEK